MELEFEYITVVLFYTLLSFGRRLIESGLYNVANKISPPQNYCTFQKTCNKKERTS